jgi:hypothetical protein
MEDKIKRNLSGIFFRHKMDNGEMDNLVFEELPESKQDEIMELYSREQLSNLCKALSKTIVRIGDHFDIAMETRNN